MRTLRWTRRGVFEYGEEGNIACSTFSFLSPLYLSKNICLLQPEYSLVTTSIIIPHGLLHIALIYREDLRVIFIVHHLNPAHMIHDFLIFWKLISYYCRPWKKCVGYVIDGQFLWRKNSLTRDTSVSAPAVTLSKVHFVFSLLFFLF